MSRNRTLVCSRGLFGGAGLMLAVLVAAGSAHGARAREFRAADIQEENYPTVQKARPSSRLGSARST
jgi:hypothetical protein